MNSIHRRLFRTFIESGGDISDQKEVDRLIRRVEASLSILSPKVRTAIEMAWGERESPNYVRMARALSRRERMDVTISAIRQRLSRGLRDIEHMIRTEARNIPRAGVR